ncbi:putative UDP-glucosyltransferase YjiC [Reticulibacter mediterranei]|uniref:Putative UDP-glucosyltransferase YjiC n=1 Tax=Reticulibacter mediterranei TaxID=2778369 RepID=A0A8J3IH48_9CHLR|nr:macrolide family glycosyltransferase [Reticulibacter mediterranei]GHO94451.1 putative UDP-glucosyltransferase YjiC [Reticulibacter mediterranei]
MAKYSFLNVPAWGHVNPTLPVVQELVRRGHEVSYYLTEDFRETIEATGAVFQPYESKIKELAKGGIGGRNIGMGPRVFILEDRKFVPPQVIDRIRAEKPDVILYDFMCGWAKVIRDELHVPAIGLRATYASNEHFNLFKHIRAGMQNSANGQEFLERFKALQAASSSENPMEEITREFTDVESLNIIFMSRAFQPMVETFDERFLFVGTSIQTRHQETGFPFDKLNTELPLLYISMGSVMTNQPEFYKHCFEAFGGQPWQVVLTVGKSTDTTQLGAVPDNFLLSPYVPQLEILPRTQVFVTHAGTNSVMESIYYGVPMVLIPQQPEQQMHARRTVELGLGVQLDKGAVTAASLREAVEHVANDPQYRTHAQEMQQRMHEDGGYQRATDAIIEFTQKHVVHV